MCLRVLDPAFSAPTATDGRGPQSPEETCGRRSTLGNKNKDSGTGCSYGLSGVCFMVKEKLLACPHNTLGGQEDLLVHFPPGSSGAFFPISSIFS